MKRVAIITTSLNGGGAERIAGLLSKALSKEYEVYVFLLFTENIVYEYGGEIVDIGYLGLFYECAIARRKCEYGIDVAISFLEIMNFANIRTKGSEKVIISERCVQSLFDKSMDAQTLKIKRYYNYADEIVSCSYGVKYDLEANFGVNNHITTIYNFINREDTIEKAKGTFEHDIAKFVGEHEFFLNVGRLDPQKNQEELINQFAVFHEKHNDIKLIILGSGELQERLNRLIEEKELQECVGIFSYTINPFVYMRHAKALILASKFEGLPNVILESMSLGCPIIATDCLSGPRELLGGVIDYTIPIKEIAITDRGILVPFLSNSHSIDDMNLAKAMEILVERDGLAESIRNNQISYMDKYSNEFIISQWKTLIENTLVENKKRIQTDKLITKGRPTLIYGAGKYGKAIYLSLKGKFNMKGFVVSVKDTGTLSYMGLPVYQVDEIPIELRDSQFILGTIEETQNVIVKLLREYGYNDIVDPIVEPTAEAIDSVGI